jgi:hypothetical protein
VAGSKATTQQVQQDTAAVNSFNEKKGDDYIGSQKQLPDVVAVGGGGNTAGPVGAGD